MMNLENVKTYAGWGAFQSLEDYLQPGDRVDNEMYEHFLNVLPPLTNTSNMLQVSEPYDHIDGRGIYCTFVFEEGCWVYKGNCFRGDTTDKTIKFGW